MTKRIICALVIASIALSGFMAPVLAQSESVYIRLDTPTIARGYTVATPDNGLKLSLAPGMLSEATAVGIAELSDMEMPWRLTRVSPIYQFEFFNKAAYDRTRPFYIQIGVREKTDKLTQVFFYDSTYSAWRPLPTRGSPDGLFVRSLIHLPYARIAVFAYPDVLAVGTASWYAQKKGNFAASPDFPAGSRLRVYNTANDKFVDVTINDYGPDRTQFPTRVVDLSKEAFSKIAFPREGIVPVRVEPLSVSAKGATTLGIAQSGVGAQPAIASRAAVILDERTGDMLYEKNSAEVLPIASLSKLIAVRVFLDASPDIERVVSYEENDAKRTYQYVDYPWEAATLKLTDGDTLTVRDLIYSALVGSANNAIETLVRSSGMAREQFIENMNLFARDLGLLSVYFDEPTGLSPNNVSSAAEYALLAWETLQTPLISKASTTKTYSFSTINTNTRHAIKNLNPLVSAGDLALTGSKTGYLREAGYCLITRVMSGANPLIAVTFGDGSMKASAKSIRELLSFGEVQAKRLRDSTHLVTQ